MTTPEENKAIVRRALDAWNAMDREAFERCYADEIFVHNLHTGNQVTWSKDQHWAAVQSTFAVFPDMHLSVEGMIAEGDRVVVRSTSRGTHTGRTERLGEPTGKTVQWAGFSEYQLRDGLIVGSVLLSDQLRLLTELGVVESARPKKEPESK